MTTAVRKMLLVDPIEPVIQYSNRLDREMNQILTDTKLSDSDKLRQYLIVLRRYILSKRTAVERPVEQPLLKQMKFEVPPPPPKEEPKTEPKTEKLKRTVTPEQILDALAGGKPSQPSKAGGEEEEEDEEDEFEEARTSQPAAAAAAATNLPERYDLESILSKLRLHTHKAEARSILEMLRKDNYFSYDELTGQLTRGANKKLADSNILLSLRYHLLSDRRRPPRPVGQDLFEEFLEGRQRILDVQKQRERLGSSSSLTGKGWIRY